MPFFVVAIPTSESGAIHHAQEIAATLCRRTAAYVGAFATGSSEARISSGACMLSELGADCLCSWSYHRGRNKRLLHGLKIRLTLGEELEIVLPSRNLQHEGKERKSRIHE